jgi:hypothetical protein
MRNIKGGASFQELPDCRAGMLPLPLLAPKPPPTTNRVVWPASSFGPEVSNDHLTLAIEVVPLLFGACALLLPVPTMAAQWWWRLLFLQAAEFG